MRIQHRGGTSLLAVSTFFVACSGSGKTSTSSASSTGSPTSSAGSTASSTSSAGGTGGTGGTQGSGGTGGIRGTGGTSATGGGSSDAWGTIVPLYTDPSDASWTAIAATAKMHPTVAVRAIINPDSGPGAAKDPGYASGIPELEAAGITVLGYVATTYGAKTPADAHAEIDDYTTWYTGLKGIFFDEMSNTAGMEAYYAELTQYAKGLGYQVTVGNPGTDTSSSYVGTVDTLLIYESSGLPALGSLGGWHAPYDKQNFGIIPYGVPSLDATFVAGARPEVGFIYLTDGVLPNPWDSLSPYFGGLLAALE